MSLDRKELKIQALRERIATLTTEYEEKVADLRVELTLVDEERQNLRLRCEELEAPVDVSSEEDDSDPTD